MNNTYSGHEPSASPAISNRQLIATDEMIYDYQTMVKHGRLLRKIMAFSDAQNELDLQENVVNNKTYLWSEHAVYDAKDGVFQISQGLIHHAAYLIARRLLHGAAINNTSVLYPVRLKHLTWILCNLYFDEHGLCLQIIDPIKAIDIKGFGVDTIRPMMIEFFRKKFPNADFAFRIESISGERPAENKIKFSSGPIVLNVLYTLFFAGTLDLDYNSTIVDELLLRSKEFIALDKMQAQETKVGRPQLRVDTGSDKQPPLPPEEKNYIPD